MSLVLVNKMLQLLEIWLNMFMIMQVRQKTIKIFMFVWRCFFDYKDRISNNTNIVPSWHSVDSFSLLIHLFQMISME